MIELTMTKRKACLIFALAALLFLCVFIIKHFGPATETVMPIESNQRMPQTSIASQNGWSPSDFFTEPSCRKLCEMISDDDSSAIDELVSSEAVDLNCIGKDGMYPLLWTYACGRKELTVRLMVAGANPDVKLLRSIPIRNRIELQEGDTFAFTMLRLMDLEMFGDCLPFISDPNQRDRRGDTLLHKLLGQVAFNSEPCERHLQLTERLINTGVDVNAKNSNGVTPLHVGTKGHRERAISHGSVLGAPTRGVRYPDVRSD